VPWVTANWVSFELTIDCQQSVRQKGEYEPWSKNLVARQK